MGCGRIANLVAIKTAEQVLYASVLRMVLVDEVVMRLSQSQRGVWLAGGSSLQNF